MKLKCKECKQIVVEGEIVERKNRRRFDISYKPKGTIIKNNSRNSDNWEGLCSTCQKKEKQ